MDLMQRPTTGMTAGAVEEGDVARAIAEVQAQVIMAKRFPRDETAAYTKIMKACGRKSLAEVAQYTYPRGGTNVEGPSIRLAEVIARHWGNIQYGFRELGRGGGGYSDVEAYAWDLETNVRVSRSLQVAHTRDKKSGTVKLSSDRDIYEHIASQAQRRVRACILEVIPGDVVDASVAECNRALVSEGVPLEDTIRNMVAGFAKIQVTKDMLEEYLQHDIEICTPAQVARLRGIFNAIKDGVGSREQYFKVTRPAPEAATDLDKKVMEGDKPKVLDEKCGECGHPLWGDHVRPRYCPACGVEPEEKPEVEVVEPPDPLACPHHDCPFVAKSQSGLTRHINAAHPEPVVEPPKLDSEPEKSPPESTSPDLPPEGRTEEPSSQAGALPKAFFPDFEERCMRIQKRFQDKFGFDAGNEKYFEVVHKFNVRNVFEVTDKQDRQMAVEISNALADALGA